MTNVILILPLVNFAEKSKAVTDSSYQIGDIIGSFLPFVLLVGMA